MIIGNEINHRVSESSQTACYWFSGQVVLMDYEGSIEWASVGARYDVIYVMRT